MKYRYMYINTCMHRKKKYKKLANKESEEEEEEVTIFVNSFIVRIINEINKLNFMFFRIL